ncbi:hypothetical protein KCP71_09195 [Salmonella enterica subsp. enterica]|nr:hypothetical protein KCP71_09195 [Salmonella enterica subsp. enterica]
MLAANGWNHQDLFAILGQLAERRLDYGDLYFQSSLSRIPGFVLIASLKMAHIISTSMLAFAPLAAKTGFAYADQISLLGVEQRRRQREPLYARTAKAR